MFSLVRRLVYFSWLSPKRILRAWKQVQVEFLRQGSSKLTSRISFIFPLGSFREGVNNFVRAQNLARKSILGFLNGPEYAFLRMKRVLRIFTHKAFSQTVPEPSSRRSRTLLDVPRRCQTLPDAPRPSETLPNVVRRSHTLPDVPEAFTRHQAFRSGPSILRRSRRSQNAPRRFHTLPDAPRHSQTRLEAPRFPQTVPDAPTYSQMFQTFQTLPGIPSLESH